VGHGNMIPAERGGEYARGRGHGTR
jgi:hypothetical protein